MLAERMRVRDSLASADRIIGRQLSCAPDPIAIAGALERSGHDDVCLLHGWPSGGMRGVVSYVAAGSDRCSAALDPAGDDDPRGELPREFRGVPRWVGVIPYECRRELERPGWTRVDRRSQPFVQQPHWRRFSAVIRIDHARGDVCAIGTPAATADLMRPVTREPSVICPPPQLRVCHHDRDSAHLERVKRAIELIARGDLYQVNLARRLDVTLTADRTLALYSAMHRLAPSRYACYLRLGKQGTVLSTTPELLLAADPADRSGIDGPSFARLCTEPVKGTRPRGRDAVEDELRRTELDADPKERAELAMIVDVERNDLGRVARHGSVRVAAAPHVVTHPAIHHRHARVVADTRPDASRRDVLAAMVPSGSVTGAPKVRAMEVIAELENARRGLYTGGIGFVARDGGVRLAMAIRTLVVRGLHGHYWTGGGIVADSDPARELEETRWKARQLLRLGE